MELNLCYAVKIARIDMNIYLNLTTLVNLSTGEHTSNSRIYRSLWQAHLLTVFGFA